MEPCEHCYIPLAWDTAFFGMNVGKVTKRSINADELASVTQAAMRRNMDCLYLFADAACPDTLEAAYVNRFKYVETRIDLRYDPATQKSPPISAPNIREATPHDRPQLVELATTMHGNTRFFRDLRIGSLRAERLYGEWISVALAKQVIYVAVDVLDQSRIAGYVTLTFDPSVRSARIGLLAVNPTFQKHGYGKGLLGAALERARRERSVVVHVTTQIDNAAALRLYRKCGFEDVVISAVFHWWSK